ncbi:tetratricopeptide (TPR) repeat protein [Chryseobacterium defluvii]|uniref:Tetratricopeptide (TPR) repeat protein n=1 Tax=Chryseobacterium defluvii TaxID=160396 RepID=A0A840KKB9_9FLAO|nr:tetratricopeptide repeat protein [Chryseobacterium defluvii]MBB4807963.1 tetratricopeptide (TPR) repeat protein [Chryseobacterium defluvii]
MTLTKNKYYFEALDNYPYSLPQCLEALNYALSYDPEDADSLCLMGRLHTEILNDYETAKTYFEEAMQSNINNISTPKYYIHCLLNNEDYEEAEKLIEFALKIKGIDKANILYWKSLLFEKRREYDKALEQIKEAGKFSYNKNMTDFLEAREKFVKDKMPKKKNKKKKGTK